MPFQCTSDQFEKIVKIFEGEPNRTLSSKDELRFGTHGSDGLDTLVVAGGCFEDACKDPSLVEWVRLTAPRVRRVASICTGAFILAAAGLLHQRRVTTHWLLSERLATAYQSIQVDSNFIFARDGNIYTSGGITAGIDLALAPGRRGSRPGSCARRSPGRWWFSPTAPGGNPNSAPI